MVFIQGEALPVIRADVVSLLTVQTLSHLKPEASYACADTKLGVAAPDHP